MAQQYLYNTLFLAWFGTKVTIYLVVEHVALDMAVLTPFLCLPIAYLVKAGMNADESLLDGIKKYWLHIQEEGLLQKYWMLCVPIQCLTFGIIPQHLRIVFIASVSFVWLMILLNISSSATPQAQNE